jgi:hypothetical protein
MSTHEALVARVRGEYREMPGLRLSFVQACRLWQMEARTCEMVLEALVTERFLVRSQNGAFMASPMTGERLNSVKAAAPRPDLRRSA